MGQQNEGGREGQTGGGQPQHNDPNKSINPNQQQERGGGSQQKSGGTGQGSENEKPGSGPNR